MPFRVVLLKGHKATTKMSLTVLLVVNIAQLQCKTEDFRVIVLVGSASSFSSPRRVRNQPSTRHQKSPSTQRLVQLLHRSQWRGRVWCICPEPPRPDSDTRVEHKARFALFRWRGKQWQVFEKPRQGRFVSLNPADFLCSGPSYFCLWQLLIK